MSEIRQPGGISIEQSTHSAVERIHTAAQNAKRHSDRLEASALICSFILERSCTHVDSVTNHSLKLKLWINICFCIVLLRFVEVMVEVMLGEVTDEEVEKDILRWLVCRWCRCWTLDTQSQEVLRPSIDCMWLAPWHTTWMMSRQTPCATAWPTAWVTPLTLPWQTKIVISGQFWNLVMCVLKTLAWLEEKSHWLHLADL